ncbi:terminase large subunit domain-containing protein [Pedobacter nyackensis]|uniref:terminase large subunit domain-containing protein n=1 Tax=Pedobacter nyackensis TaxID=475255 RepID=UPI00292F7F92|nr:terminase family protein [Pedobacter nyackensis]
MNLTIKQTQVFDLLQDSVTTEIIYGGAAGGGKSIIICLWLVNNCITYPETRWLLGRSKLEALKKSTLNSFFDVCKILQLVNGEHYNYNQQSNIITFTNGSQIILKDLFSYPSDPNFDSLGSIELTGAAVDECNQITDKCWNILKTRIRYKLDEYGLIPKLLGSCNPSKNWVYSEFYKKSNDGTLEPHKRFIQALVTDNPYISQHYIKSLQQNPDEATRQRLLFGNWQYDNDPSALLSYDQIIDLFSNKHVNPDPTKKALTCDIATDGADKFIICAWEGYVVQQFNVIAKSNGKEVIDAIESMANQFGIQKSRIVYDADGVGNFVGGFLQGAKAFKNGSRALNDENYKNLKTQCIYKFCERASSGGYYIKDQRYKQDIIVELEQLKRCNQDNDTGKLEVVSKDVIKSIIGHSPDFSDSLIMREYLELKQPFFFV